MTTRALLLIDDDRDLAYLITKSLARQDFSVRHVDTLGAGLELLSVSPPHFDVIALDHRLPDGTGLEFLAATANAPDRPPVVYFTASAETPIAVAALKAGAVDYVPKNLNEDFIELFTSSLQAAIASAEILQAKLAADREIREARDRAELLLQEVNHRVANSLALVASLVRMQAQENPQLKELLGETLARITAVADVHRSLYLSETGAQIEMAAYVSRLAGDLENALGALGSQCHAVLDLEPIYCSVDRAVSLGMIVTELLTNVHKYAYPLGKTGEVRVRLANDRRAGLGIADRGLLIIEDDGVGFTGSGGGGLGAKIISMMAKSLNGSLRYERPERGARAIVDFDLR